MPVKTEKKQRSSNLYLNMILKWDEPIEMVRRSISSVIEYVDGAYITITFPDDNFKKNTPLEKVLKKEFGANVSYFKWVDDFSAARNFALTQVPRGKNNFIYWQDADDTLQGAEHLHDISDIAATYSHAAVFFHYWYMVDFDENGEIRNVVVDQVRERVVRNDGTFKWVGMLHETLIEQKQENVMKVDNDKCIVIHISSDSKRMDTNIERNIRILEKGIKIEKRKDPRTLVFLAKTYVDKGKMSKDPATTKINFNLALTLFGEYLDGYGKPGTPGYQEGSGWPQERATAWGYIADVAVISGNYSMAIESLQSAINEAPEFPNYYVDLAMVYSIMGDFKKAKHWLTVATSMENPKTTIIQTPRDFMTRALEVGYQVGMNTNNLELAKDSSEKLIEIYPTLPDYQERLKSVESLIKANKVSQSIVFLGKILEEKKDKEKLEYLVKAIPEDLIQERFASEMRHLFLSPKKWENNEIAMICGPGFEQWSPDSLKTGLGGSEEAVVYLSKELIKLGWKVTVYANPGPKHGDHDGVKYLQWYDFNVKDEFNVLILWRALGFVDFKPKSKFTMLWLHDIPNNPDFTDDRISQVNKIAILSEYHKSLLRIFKNGEYKKMPDEKVFLTSNGIVNLKIPKKNKRDPYRLIYSSSPDRGLIHLLTMWPEIIKEVPKANLHIYYGFEIFDKIYPDNPGKQKWKNMILEGMKQEGITYHGRVGHDELHKAMAESSIWAYPTDFDEISCITAMKCQALGAIPVVINRGALKETVKNGIKIDVDISTKEGQKEYSKQLIRILKSTELQEEIRPNMIEWAKDYFTWDKVAIQWDKEFRIKLQNPELAIKEGV